MFKYILGINYDAYGTLQSWINNSSLTTFFEKESCLKRVVGNYTLNDIGVSVFLIKKKVILKYLTFFPFFLMQYQNTLISNCLISNLNENNSILNECF